MVAVSVVPVAVVVQGAVTAALVRLPAPARAHIDQFTNVCPSPMPRHYHFSPLVCDSIIIQVLNDLQIQSLRVGWD